MMESAGMVLAMGMISIVALYVLVVIITGLYQEYAERALRDTVRETGITVAEAERALMIQLSEHTKNILDENKRSHSTALYALDPCAGVLRAIAVDSEGRVQTSSHELRAITVPSDAKCPVCHALILDGGALVFCGSCRLAHHEECWNENKKCAAYGCADDGAIHFESPAELSVAAVREEAVSLFELWLNPSILRCEAHAEIHAGWWATCNCRMVVIERMTREFIRKSK